MVQHHLTDEVSDPASPFSPCLCFSFLQASQTKKNQLPTVPGVFSCQRLGCTTTNQPLSGRDGALKAADSGMTGGYKASCNFCQGYDHQCL